MPGSFALFYHVPLVGWLLRDAIEGKPDAKYYFAFNVIVSLGFLLATFGYPLLIGIALTLTASVLTALVILTASDFL